MKRKAFLAQSGCLFVLLSALPALAQNPAAPAVAPQINVTLGNSAVALNGPWKFAPGDSPMVNGAPLWAQPDFDDSKWVALDLAPKSGSIDPAYGTPGFVPGWTKRGFPDLYG